MAVSTAVFVMDEKLKHTVHPFFTTPKVSLPPVSATPQAHETSEPKDQTRDDKDVEVRRQDPLEENVELKKAGTSLPASEEAQRGFMAKFTGRTTRELTAEVDPNYGRRKRQKTESPPQHTSIGDFVSSHKDADTLQTNGLSWREQLEQEAQAPVRLAAQRPTPPQSVEPMGSIEPPPACFMESREVPPSSLQPLNPSAHEQADHMDPPGLTNTTGSEMPRKMLRLNASGKLGSPPSKNAKSSSAVPTDTKLGKKRTRGTRIQALVVQLKYGSEPTKRSTIGNQIDSIMAGTMRWPLHRIQKPDSEKLESKQPLKATHPFFLGKQIMKEDDSSKPRVDENRAPRQLTPRKSAVTPGKLRAQARAHLALDQERYPLRSPFDALEPATVRTSLSSRGDVSWPSRETRHVRGLSSENGSLNQQAVSPARTIEHRKQKHRRANVPLNEDLISKLSGQLSSMTHRDVGHQRLPQRLLVCGELIQEMARAELRTLTAAANQGKQLTTLLPMYLSIPKTLTPFDMGVCERLSWTQKYAPRETAEVLQTGKEIEVMRDWLQKCAVHASEKGLQLPSKDKLKNKKQKKRKRKDTDMYGFIVSEDDSIASLDELSDAEGDTSLPSHGKSVVRGASTAPGAKLANVILLTGPHGCGKTAGVYAVAKELGFEVFEINAGHRRSGRDILERVGDMAENHLVQQQVAKELQLDLKQEPLDLDAHPDSTKDEVASGRQGTMESFFKSNGGPVQRTITKQKDHIKEKKKSVNPGASKSTKQKQSLILFEEVDVLFDEDQGFWATVRALATHSKRPIIMTCNDESLVRIEEEALHAILRFKPPPGDLAVDYLLLIAAREGHLLDRKAVSALYASRNHDLRASIVELDFWCQMGVGDRKGGLEWIYQRWPPGKDVDEEGRTLRVASRHTCVAGMGWYSQDLLAEQACFPSVRSEDVMREICQNWDLTPDLWPSTGETSSKPRVNGQVEHHLADQERSVSLKMAERNAEIISSANIFCRYGTQLTGESDLLLQLDPSIPPTAGLSGNELAEGYPVLQAAPVEDFNGFNAKLACQTRILLGRGYEDLYTGPVESHLSPLKDKSIQCGILEHQSAKYCRPTVTPSSIATALEPLTVPATSSTSLAQSVVPSLTSIDRPSSIVVADIAPYVRSIAAYDQKLESQRLRLSGLLSVRAGPGERKVRKTRAARSALEGGRRETTRRERWFSGPSELNFVQVMRTGGRDWVEHDEDATGTASVNLTETGSALGSTEQDAMSE